MRYLMMVSLSFAAGTVFSEYVLPLALHVRVAACCLLLFLLGILLKGRIRTITLIVTMTLAVSMGYNYWYRSHIEEKVAVFVGENQSLTVQVLTEPEQVGNRYRMEVEVFKGESTLRGMLYQYGKAYDVSPGDFIKGTMSLDDASMAGDTPITSFTSSGVYLMVYPDEEVTVIEGEDSLWFLPQKIAKAFMQELNRLYEPPCNGLMQALLLGERTNLPDGITSDLRESGIYHMTAVSGLHCGFVLAILAPLIGFHRRKILSAIVIPILILYTLAVGAPASMVRATVMLILFLLAPLFDRESDPPTSLTFALLLLLLWNPYSIGGVGLQLSFASMGGLLLFTKPIYRLFPPIQHTLLRGALYTFCASISCMALTVPLSAYYFGTISLVAPIGNILCLAAASFTFSVGFLSVLLGLAVPFLGEVLAIPGSLGARYMIAVSDGLASVPFHSVSFENPYLIYWVIFVAVLFFFFARCYKTRRHFLLSLGLALATLAVTVWLPIREYRDAALHIAAIDVGQGACTVFRSGGKTVMVDCGSSNTIIEAGSKAANTLTTWGCFSLDYLVLTHYHADHGNGLPILLSRMKVGALLVPKPTEEETSLHQEIAALCSLYDIPIYYTEQVTTLPVGEATMTLFPSVGDGDTNEEGQSILFTKGELDVLITGDMSGTHEKKLLSQYELPDLEILLVGHHGSKYSTDEQLLDALMPEVGIISVGQNSYGHPTEETITRMEERGMTVYRTDKQGTISIVTGKESP